MGNESSLSCDNITLRGIDSLRPRRAPVFFSTDCTDTFMAMALAEGTAGTPWGWAPATL